MEGATVGLHLRMTFGVGSSCACFPHIVGIFLPVNNGAGSVRVATDGLSTRKLQVNQEARDEHRCDPVRESSHFTRQQARDGAKNCDQAYGCVKLVT